MCGCTRGGLLFQANTAQRWQKGQPPLGQAGSDPSQDEMRLLHISNGYVEVIGQAVSAHESAD